MSFILFFWLNLQVLFCYDQFDELTLLHLREFDKKQLISVETDIVVDHYKEENFEASKAGRSFAVWLFFFVPYLLAPGIKRQNVYMWSHSFLDLIKLHIWSLWIWRKKLRLLIQMTPCQPWRTGGKSDCTLENRWNY